MKRIARIFVILLVVIATTSAVVLFLLYRASQQEPEFYEQALRIEPSQYEEAGDELEKNVLDLRNEVQQVGRWEATFTDAQINGWLAVDMPKKFPNTLPSTVSDPRVSIIPKLAQLACRYTGSRFSAVVSLGLEIRTTDEPNVVAVRLKRIRAGSVPLPVVEKWKDELEKASLRAELPLKWEQIDGDDVALVTIPTGRSKRSGGRLLLETIELRNGEVYLAGRTEPSEGSDSSNHFHTASDQSVEKITIQR